MFISLTFMTPYLFTHRAEKSYIHDGRACQMLYIRGFFFYKMNLASEIASVSTAIRDQRIIAITRGLFTKPVGEIFDEITSKALDALEEDDVELFDEDVYETLIFNITKPRAAGEPIRTIDSDEELFLRKWIQVAKKFIVDHKIQYVKPAVLLLGNKHNSDPEPGTYLTYMNMYMEALNIDKTKVLLLEDGPGFHDMPEFDGFERKTELELFSPVTLYWNCLRIIASFGAVNTFPETTIPIFLSEIRTSGIVDEDDIPVWKDNITTDEITSLRNWCLTHLIIWYERQYALLQEEHDKYTTGRGNEILTYLKGAYSTNIKTRKKLRHTPEFKEELLFTKNIRDRAMVEYMDTRPEPKLIVCIYGCNHYNSFPQLAVAAGYPLTVQYDRYIHKHISTKELQVLNDHTVDIINVTGIHQWSSELINALREEFDEAHGESKHAGRRTRGSSVWIPLRF